MTVESASPAVASDPTLDAGPAPAAVPARAARLLHGLWRQWMQTGEFAGLALPTRQPLLVELRRAALILSRLRIVAALSAVLTLAWIVVDLLVLPLSTAIVVAIARGLAAAAFAWLAVSVARRSTLRGTYASLALLYAIATCLYVFAVGEILASRAAAAQAQSLLALYAGIPLIAVMSLCVFPLTILEVLALAAIMGFGNVVAASLGTWHAAPGHWLAGSWLLLLATAIAGLACANQIGLLRALARQAMRDPLTGCYSRSSMEALLELHFANAARRATPLAIALVDLDDFRSLNDACGHAEGDRVLERLGKWMRSISRRGDMVGRWGGEEFLLLFPHSAIDRCATMCERLHATGFGTGPDGRLVTASIGLAEKDRDGAQDWQALVAATEARLLEAKRRGKNRVVAW